MTWKIIRLPRGVWQYNPQKLLGKEGGSGQVFLGKGNDSTELAIKRLKLSAQEAAHRELRIADELAEKKLQNVMPIFDSGLDAESEHYFLVMPKAEKNLQDDIDIGKLFDEKETAKILLQIVNGLTELPKIVHRDLKPLNILFHEGKWKIADYGIARFIEESTSQRTLQGWLTPPYAAPEQWQFEQVTSATDLYALGCIAYALLTGKPPFMGPDEDYREQHLHAAPPVIESCSSRMRSFLSTLLRKQPETRPPRDRVAKILREILTESGIIIKSGLNELAEAGAYAAEIAAKRETEEARVREEHSRRMMIAQEGNRSLASIINDLFAMIKERAPTAYEDSDLGHKLVRLERAEIKISNSPLLQVYPPDKSCIEASGWDIVMGNHLIVVQQSLTGIVDNNHYEWSASLWYAKLNTDESYRWYEVSYYNYISMTDGRYQPYSLNIDDAKHVLLTGLGPHAIAFGPKPIDDEDSGDFCDRWAGLFAKAVRGQLRHPGRMPLQ